MEKLNQPLGLPIKDIAYNCTKYIKVFAPDLRTMQKKETFVRAKIRIYREK